MPALLVNVGGEVSRIFVINRVAVTYPKTIRPLSTLLDRDELSELRLNMREGQVRCGESSAQPSR